MLRRIGSLLSVLATLSAHRCASAEWSQQASDAQGTGYTAEHPATPWALSVPPSVCVCVCVCVRACVWTD